MHFDCLFCSYETDSFEDMADHYTKVHVITCAYWMASKSSREEEEEPEIGNNGEGA